MAFTNFDTKEIHCKLVYFGAPGAGTTENLRALYRQTAEDLQSGLVEMGVAASGRSFFDFLPLSLGYLQGYHLKLHLFTLPFQPVYETVASVVLQGIDGFVFVADSRIERMAENFAALSKVRQALASEGYNVVDLPRVIQYNRRDMGGVAEVDLLRRELNPGGVPDQEAIACQSLGTMETLLAMAKQVIYKLAPTS